MQDDEMIYNMKFVTKCSFQKPEISKGINAPLHLGSNVRSGSSHPNTKKCNNDFHNFFHWVTNSTLRFCTCTCHKRQVSSNTNYTYVCDEVKHLRQALATDHLSGPPMCIVMLDVILFKLCDQRRTVWCYNNQRLQRGPQSLH